MTTYRRPRIAGGCYFFTLALAERQSTLLIDQATHLHEAIRQVKTRHPFQIDAMAVLPDHLHCIWTLPENDADYSTRWNLIKGAFSRGIVDGERRRTSRVVRRERGIWQRRFWEHAIRGEQGSANDVLSAAKRIIRAALLAAARRGNINSGEAKAESKNCERQDPAQTFIQLPAGAFVYALIQLDKDLQPWRCSRRPQRVVKSTRFCTRYNRPYQI